ncbi:unnamed protein product [Blepharisma stoltei]|uniref:TmcB/TmcC TPR repeats domain-containing protein n=1 Tax=Blepharisma stoltei TaxID=1481888 RepID=A0AAU9I726_9CILI|nr:unnamed protein product [Blepharisma stoltei]
MARLRSEVEEGFIVTHKIWKSKEEKSIKDSVFELYQLMNYEENSALNQKFKIIIKSIIWSLQIVSLLWIPDLPVKNWHKNMIIWDIIGYLKFDNTCSMLGVFDWCFYLSMLLAYGNFIVLIIFVIIIYYSYPYPRLALNIFSRIIYIWLNFFLVPSIQIFSIFLKYSFLPKTKVSEYENHSELGEFSMVSPLQISIVFAILITFILKLFQVEFSGEIRHSVNKIKINAKAHSKIDVHIAIFTFFSPIVYVMLAENYIIYLQILVIIFAILLITETIELLPYFSIFLNSVILIRLYFIGFIASIFLLGSLMDNSLAISMLAVILVPLSAIFVIQFSLKSQKETTQAIPEDLIEIESQYTLEKSLRYALCSNDAEHKDQIIRVFENFFIQKGLNGNKLQAIWAANYCLYTLKDESLAKIKLSKTKNILDWSLESNYQEYLCQKNISNTCLSEDSQFSDYFLQSIIVKNEEKQLCINLLLFWSEITSHEPNLPKLRKKLYSIEDEILLLNKKYDQLITKFPNSKSLLSLYHSYCKDIIYNTEKSISLEAKLRSVDKALKNFNGDSKEFSFFNENNGTLIISNEDRNFGEIVYADQKAAEFLKLPIGNIENENFSNFIHPYYKDKFREDTKWFIHYSSFSGMDLSKGFFLIKDGNILLQLEGKVLLTSINNLLMAILVFKPKSSKHEVALISEAQEIICHSDNFSKSIGKSESLVGLSLKNLFFNSEEISLQPDIPYHLPSLKTYIILSYSKFYEIKIPYVILINDYDEVLKWKNGISQSNNDQIQAPTQFLSLNLSGSLSSNKTDGSFNKGSQNSDENLNSKRPLHKNSKEFQGKNADDISEKFGSEKSVTSVTPRHNKLLCLIKSSSRSINVLHFAFVFSILTVLAVNITVLVYAFSNINFISDMRLPINIGKAAKNLQRFTYVSKLFMNVVYLPDNPALKQIFGDVQSCLTDLENTYIDVTTNLEKWNYCSGQNILTEKKLKHMECR